MPQPLEPIIAHDSPGATVHENPSKIGGAPSAYVKLRSLIVAAAGRDNVVEATEGHVGNGAAQRRTRRCVALFGQEGRVDELLITQRRLDQAFGQSPVHHILKLGCARQGLLGKTRERVLILQGLRYPGVL